MTCLPCGRRLHEECRSPVDEKCCCGGEVYEEETPIIGGIEKRTVRAAKEGVGISAGRKRAATLYPLNLEAPCEWRMLSNCGGGLYPIVGCVDGFQQTRHHGPVKNTEYNNRSNIHLICHNCHNRWHTANDPHYDRNDKEAEARFALLPHQPRDVTGKELVTRKVDNVQEN